jgi:hypothetical protein
MQSLFDSKLSNPIVSDNAKEIQKTKEYLSQQILQDIPMRPYSHGYAVYYDGWIYLQQGCTLRMRPDGTQTEMLDDIYGNFMMVIPEGIFIQSNTEKGDVFLFRMDHDGSNRIRLNSQFTTEFDINNGWIYYLAPPHFGKDTGPYSSLYRMKLDGNDKEELVKNALVMDFTIYKDWIYYTTLPEKKENGEYESVFGRIRLDGTQYEEGVQKPGDINGEYVENGVIINGWQIYASNTSDSSSSVYAKLIDEDVSFKICDCPTRVYNYSIDIAGGILFLKQLYSGSMGSWSDYYKMFKVPLSGGECTYMESLSSARLWKVPDET